MTDVSASSAQRHQAFHLSISIVRSEVEMQPVLAELRFGHTAEQKTGEPPGAGSNLEFVGVLVDNDPTKRLAPPPPKGSGVASVDDRLLPLKTDTQIVEPRVYAAQCLGRRFAADVGEGLVDDLPGALDAAKTEEVDEGHRPPVALFRNGRNRRVSDVCDR